MDDTYGFDDNTDLYDPNMDVSIDDTDRLIEDMERVQGNFEDALTKAQKWFKIPFDKNPGSEDNDGLDGDESSEKKSVELDEIPIKLVAIEIDHNLVPNNTTDDLTDFSSQSRGTALQIFYALYFKSLFI